MNKKEISDMLLVRTVFYYIIRKRDMIQMEWDTLVSTSKIPVFQKDLTQNWSLASSFDSDYRRVVKSDAFRRLQDKTQVFPLERNDFVRTRLTHSLEVAVVTRDLLTEVIKLAEKREIHTDLLSECYRLMETAMILATHLLAILAKRLFVFGLKIMDLV